MYRPARSIVFPPASQSCKRVFLLAFLSLGTTCPRSNPCADNPGGRYAGGIEAVSYDDFRVAADLMAWFATVRIDNYTSTQQPSSEFKFFRRNGSRFTVDDFGGAIDAPDETFTVTPIRLPDPWVDQNNRGGPYTVYLDNLVSIENEVFLDVDDGRLIIRIPFESEGLELRVNCVDNIICVGDPNLHLDNAVMELRFAFTDNPNGIRIASVEADFEADIAEGEGLCQDNFFAFLCPMFLPGDTELKREIEDGIVNSLGDGDTRERLEGAFRELFRRIGSLPTDALVTWVEIEIYDDLAIAYTLPCPPTT